MGQMMGTSLVHWNSALGSSLMEALYQHPGDKEHWFVQRWDLPEREVKLKCGAYIEVEMPQGNIAGPGVKVPSVAELRKSEDFQAWMTQAEERWKGTKRDIREEAKQERSGLRLQA
jgi:hypothetical protein